MGNCCFPLHHEGYAMKNEFTTPVLENNNEKITQTQYREQSPSPVVIQTPNKQEAPKGAHVNNKDANKNISADKRNDLDLPRHDVPAVIVTTPRGSNCPVATEEHKNNDMQEVKVVLDKDLGVKDSVDDKSSVDVDDMSEEEFLRMLPNVSFSEYMLSEMRKYGNAIALVDAVSGDQLTYTQVIARVHALAGGLTKLGVEKGDVLCLCTQNSIDFPVVMLATMYIGGIFQVINPLDTADDFVRTFTECETKVVIAPEENIEKLESVHTRVSTLQHVIVYGESNSHITFQSLLDSDIKVDPPCFDPKTTPAIMLPSSGTTGLPKAVQHTHYSVTTFLHQMAGVNSAPVGSCCIQFLPMYHVFGILISTSSCLQQGLRIIVMLRFSPEQLFGLIERHFAYILHVVPPILLLFTKHPKVKEFDLSSVKVILCGAAPLKEELEKAVKERLSDDCKIYQGYGLTEAPVLFANRGKNVKPGSCGKLLPATKCKIIDPETSDVLRANKCGELCVKGPQVMMGYLNRPEATAQTFDYDGWMHTGDKAYIDADGFMFIVGRLKELIKYKGHQVPPAQLEDILIQHPGIADAAVVGVPDEEAGELPRAFVVLKLNCRVTENEVMEFVNSKVAPHMKLRGGVVFVDSIPKSGSGKILRRVIKEKYMKLQQ